MKTFSSKRFNHSVVELRDIVEEYMMNVVDGDDFKESKEIGFEEAVRKQLKKEGFTVFDKHNVKNTIELAQNLYSEKIDLQATPIHYL